MRPNSGYLTIFLLCALSMALIPTSNAAPAIHMPSDKLGLFFKHVLKPFSNMMGVLTTSTQSHLRNAADKFRSFVAPVEGSNIAQKELVEVKIIGLPEKAEEKEDDEDDDKDDGISAEGLDTGRLLQEFSGTRRCQNGGIETTARVNIYQCGGETVSRLEFLRLNGTGTSCSINQEVQSVCYCSWEYYGDRCQLLNFFTCEVVEISNTGNCTGKDSFDYVYGYGGEAPCYYVYPGATVNLKTKLKCSYNNPNFAYEGVKPLLNGVVRQPDLGSNVFSYAIDAANFKLVQPFRIHVDVHFINYDKITQPVSFSTVLNNEQIAGNQTITTPLNFNPTVVPLSTIGRYYYEIEVNLDTSRRSSISITKGYASGVFEDATYVEPSAPGRLSTAVIVILSVIGALVLTGIILAYKLHQKRVYRNIIDRSHFQAIMQDQ